MARTGRPKIEVDWVELHEHMEAHSPIEELAAIVGCDVKTLNSACRRDNNTILSRYIERRKRIGKARLRLRRAQKAWEGDSERLIEWLSKQWFGETDKPSDNIRAELPARQLELMNDDKHSEYAGIQLLLAALDAGTGGGE